MKISLFLMLLLTVFSVSAQKGPFSATLTNPTSRTYTFDPKQKIPQLTSNCFTADGKLRAYFCEFAIVELEIIGRNGVSLGKIMPAASPTAPPATISLRKSQATSNTEGADGKSGTLDYRLILRYRRVAKPAFPSIQYTISTATVDHPSTPSELKVITTFPDTAGKLPGPVHEYDFIITLSYSGGTMPSLNPGSIRYIQLANPATFAQIKSPTNNLSDRAEAFLRFFFSVDFAK